MFLYTYQSFFQIKNVINNKVIIVAINLRVVDDSDENLLCSNFYVSRGEVSSSSLGPDEESATTMIVCTVLAVGALLSEFSVKFGSD